MIRYGHADVAHVLDRTIYVDIVTTVVSVELTCFAPLVAIVFSEHTQERTLATSGFGQDNNRHLVTDQGNTLTQIVDADNGTEIKCGHDKYSSMM